jgi:polysaccharide export outer membrane protein
MPGLSKVAGLGAALAWTSVAAITLATNHARADDLVSQTKLRLTVLHWLPMEGEFRRWDALSGELQVSADGQLSLPLLGAVSTEGLGADALAGDIADRLQERLGLLERPEVRLEVIEQPPIYVVGAVETPGEYTFRPGLTVLQALALGGGPLRSQDVGAPQERIELLSKLQILNGDIHNVLARLARLDAESSSAEVIAFPDEVTEAAEGPSITLHEQSLFTARVGALQRQQTALEELRELYNAEIDVLQVRVTNLDDRISATEDDLERVATLFERGLATTSQRTELEILLGDLRSDRLDHLTAIMRARQFLSQVGRDITGLQDTRRSEIAQGLLTERATLERLRTEQTTTRKLLEELDRKLMTPGTGSEQAVATLVYTVIRGGESGSIEATADELTQLQPGDVVRVAVQSSVQSRPSGMAATAMAASGPAIP